MRTDNSEIANSYISKNDSVLYDFNSVKSCIFNEKTADLENSGMNYSWNQTSNAPKSSIHLFRRKFITAPNCG